MQLIVSLACMVLAAYLGWLFAAWCYRVWCAVSIVRKRNNPINKDELAEDDWRQFRRDFYDP